MHWIAVISLSLLALFLIGLLVRKRQELRARTVEIESLKGRLLSEQTRMSESENKLAQASRQLEEARRALLRGEKLANVGSLAAGVAHEVGNPLGAVIGYLSILKSWASESESKDLLSRSESELNRISRTIRQLLDYARPSSLDKKLCDVNDLIRSTVEAIKGREGGLSTGYELILSGGLPQVELDADALRQVLWNLLLNAADAVEEIGVLGKIRIANERISLESLRSRALGAFFQAQLRKGDSVRPDQLGRRVRRRKEDTAETEVEKLRAARGEIPTFLFEKEGEAICISVEDNGPGIVPDDLPKIFDPFFSTKAVGKGTGLGLFISRNLVESMGGYLDVLSDLDQGCRFFIILPLHEMTTQSLRGDAPLVL